MDFETVQHGNLGKNTRNPYILKYPWAMHALIKHVYGGSIRAPVADKLKAGGRALDVGCGSGAFVVDLATHYPKCTVVGVDFVPDFPDEPSRPANAGFLNCTALHLPFPDDSFDYVTQRHLREAFTVDEWPLVLRELLRVCKPGGWVELYELNFSKSSFGPSCDVITRKMAVREKNLNLESEIASKLPKLLQDTRMVSDVKVEERKFPIGSWGDNVGTLVEKCIETIWDSQNLFSEYGMTKAEHDVMLELMLSECNPVRAFLQSTSICAQKIDNDSCN